jgi:hypothetical protein
LRTGVRSPLVVNYQLIEKYKSGKYGDPTELISLRKEDRLLKVNNKFWEELVPDQYLCLVHTLVYSFIFIVLMSGNTCALVPKIPETS